MANRIKIRRGSGTPTTSNTEAYELAYDYSADKLYIHDGASSTMVQIGGGNADTLDGLDSTQFLRSDADDTTSGELTAAEFIGPLRGPVKFTAKAGEALSKGDAVYISGISGNTPVVNIADANNSSKMPAFGLSNESASLNSNVEILTFGDLTNYNTSTFNVGDVLYVSTAGTTGNTLTATAPTGESSLIQNIGMVTRDDSSVGRIKVGGAGRTNATPNLDQDKIFLGNASNQAVSTALSSIGLSKFNNDSGFTTNTGTVDTSGSPVANEYARFTDNNTIEGRSYAGVRTDLGLNIGSDVQAYDALLQDIADLSLSNPTQDGYVLAYNDATPGLELVAQSGGISFNGSTTNGLLTYGNSTTADVEQNLTFGGSHLKLLVDGGKFIAGADEDFSFYHSGTHSWIDNLTGNLYIRNQTDDGQILMQTDDGSGGTTTYMSLKGNEQLTRFLKSTRHNDGVIAQFGTSNDLKIQHDGSNSWIYNDTGNLYIENRVDDGNLIFRGDDGAGGLTGYVQLDGGAKRILLKEDIAITAAKKLYLDGGSDTYIHEPSGNQIGFVTGGNTRLLVMPHKTYINSTGANGLVINNDEGATTNSGRIFFEGNTTTAIMQEADDFSIRTGATTGSSSGTERFKVNTSGVGVVGNITVSGTVDGRDVASDGSKLDGIESGATADQTASEILTAIKTVDGNSSGLDADLLDGYHQSSFTRKGVQSGTPNTASSRTTFTCNDAIPTTSGNQSGLEVWQDTVGADAFMTFHVANDYAVYFGLDGGTNDLAVGGWSRGANSYKIWHQGNDGSGSTLDADLLDGLHGSSYWSKSGSWAGDLTSNGYTRVQGVSNGGGEFVLALKNGQLHTLIDGSYIAYEGSSAAGGGFWSSYNSAYGNASGFVASANDKIRVQQLDGGTADLEVTGNIKLTNERGLLWDYTPNTGVGGYIAHPGGGMYRTSTGTHTGAITITIPTGGAPADMISFWVDVFDYISYASQSFYISGYVYQTAGSNEWVNETAMMLTSKENHARTVRFGHNGTNHVVYIGELADTWSYPQVTVRNVQIGYSSDVDTYNDNWDISFEASAFQNVDANYFGADTLPSAGKIKMTDGSGKFIHNTTSSRDKIRVWSTSNYAIGMQSGHNFGALDNNYAMTFNMNDQSNRGFWWGDDGHSNSQGAMSLSTNGKLTVATNLRVGYGESDTSIESTYGARIKGPSKSARLETPYGYVDIGSENAGWGHIQTDRASFYFNKKLTVDEGVVQSYDEDLSLRRAQSSADRIDIAADYTRVIVNNNEEFRVDGSGSLTTGISRATEYFQANNNGVLLRLNKSTWTNATTHDIIYNAYGTNFGDYTYLKSAGNSTGTHGIIVAADSYIFMGRDDLTTGAIDNSATAPITDCNFRLDASGNGLFDGDVVAYSTTIASDARLKENVEDLNYGLKDVLNIRPVSFDWIDKRDGQHDIGVIAQEIEKIIPEVVVEVDTLNSEDTHKTVDYAKLTSVLIKAVQEQQQQINELKEKLNV